MFNSRISGLVKHISSTFKYSTIKTEDPLSKTWNVLYGDLKSDNQFKYPEHTDVVIIGGGFIGSSVAYWLKNRAGKGLSTVVLDKDLSYKNTQNILSLNSISQHYSLPENILLSEFSVDFLRNINEHLGSDVQIKYRPHDYLLLASEKYADILERNVQIQREYGIINKLLSVKQIQEKYPWISTSDIKLGCIGTEHEGIFDSENLLKGLVLKSKSLGTTYVEGEVIGFNMELQRDLLIEGVTPGSFRKINHVIYRTEDKEVRHIKFAACVIATGTDTHEIAKFANIGTSEGLLAIPIPIEKRQFNIYSINPSNGPTASLSTPYMMDTSGLWIRRNNYERNVICSQIPPLKSDINFNEEEFYNTVFKPSLTNRIPNYKDAKLNLLKHEMYDCNTYDDSGIIGPHIYHTNLYFAAGFGRQGIQHAPGIGRAIAELIIDNQFTSIDLIRFGFDRILMDEPLVESNIY